MLIDELNRINLYLTEEHAHSVVIYWDDDDHEIVERKRINRKVAFNHWSLSVQVIPCTCLDFMDFFRRKPENVGSSLHVVFLKTHEATHTEWLVTKKLIFKWIEIELCRTAPDNLVIDWLWCLIFRFFRAVARYVYISPMLCYIIFCAHTTSNNAPHHAMRCHATPHQAYTVWCASITHITLNAHRNRICIWPTHTKCFNLGYCKNNIKVQMNRLMLVLLVLLFFSFAL